MNVIMKSPSNINTGAAVILQDGTSATVDAFGFITVDSKYVAGQMAQGFLPMIAANDALPEALYNDMTNTTAATIAAAALVAKDCTIDMNGTLGAGAALTLPTVAQLVALIPGWNVNMVIKLRVMNSGAGAFAWTLTTATGWGTLLGTATVAQNTWRDFLITFQSATAATFNARGTGTNS
jgi:hypothetical protein